jgi:hypothetical protein
VKIGPAIRANASNSPLRRCGHYPARARGFGSQHHARALQISQSLKDCHAIKDWHAIFTFAIVRRHKVFGNARFDSNSSDASQLATPTRTDGITRTLEQQTAARVGFDPIIGGDSKVAQALADHAEEVLLHIISNRTPTFTLFGKPDYFLEAFGDTTPACAPTVDAAN